MKENWHNDDGKTYASSGCLPGCLCTLAVGAMIATTCYTAYKNPNSIKEYSNLAIDETTDLTSVIKQRGYSKISDNPIFAKSS